MNAKIDRESQVIKDYFEIYSNEGPEKLSKYVKQLMRFYPRKEAAKS